MWEEGGAVAEEEVEDEEEEGEEELPLLLPPPVLVPPACVDIPLLKNDNLVGYFMYEICRRRHHVSSARCANSTGALFHRSRKSVHGARIATTRWKTEAASGGPIRTKGFPTRFTRLEEQAKWINHKREKDALGSQQDFNRTHS